MASFLADQLDFIFFCYGLAFILLGVVGYGIGNGRAKAEGWAYLGLFGWIHGVSEWLDLLALTWGDRLDFAALRVAVMTLSYLALAEFARLQGFNFGLKQPRRWLYLPLAAIVMTGGILGGPREASALARYLIGFPATLATALVFLRHGRQFSGDARRRAMMIAFGFALYGIASGLIVPAVPFWPGRIVNQTGFFVLTGTPIQLVRAVIAVVLTFLILRVSVRMHARAVASRRYTEFARRDFPRAITAVAITLALGWMLTDALGDAAERGIERQTRGEVEMIAATFHVETGYVDRIDRMLAASLAPSSRALAGPATGERRERALALAMAAAGAEFGYVTDSVGKIVVSVPAGPANSRPASVAAGFLRDPVAGGAVYYGSAPIYDGRGRMLGTAVLAKPVAAITAGLAGSSQCYYLVDPAGKVIATNRPAMLHGSLRSLLPQLPPGSAAISATSSRVTIAGAPALLAFHPVGDGGWSVVVQNPGDRIAADRFLGILVTLIATMAVPAYFLLRERRMRDDILNERRRALQSLAQDFETLANTDRLTGLFNRMKFDEMLSAKLSYARRYGVGFGIIMYDVDHFKAVNDEFGHPAGDRVLSDLARIVAGHIRESDLLARWGGEEFIILLPDTDGRSTYATAEKLRAAIAATEIDTVGNVRCSFGVTEYGAGDTAETILARVDAALYRAKRKGRNRVEFARVPTGLDRSTGA